MAVIQYQNRIPVNANAKTRKRKESASVNFVLRSFLISVAMCIVTSTFLHSQRRELQRDERTIWHEAADAPWETVKQFRKERHLLGAWKGIPETKNFMTEVAAIVKNQDSDITGNDDKSTEQEEEEEEESNVNNDAELLKTEELQQQKQKQKQKHAKTQKTTKKKENAGKHTKKKTNGGDKKFKKGNNGGAKKKQTKNMTTKKNKEDKHVQNIRGTESKQTNSPTVSVTSSTTFFETAAPTLSKEARIAQCKEEAKLWYEQIEPARTTKRDERRLQLEAAESVKAARQDENKDETILVIAHVPVDSRHVIALWTELECFSASFDHVMITTAYWAKSIVKQIVKEAKRTIPHFKSGRVAIEVSSYDNRKYDVGLWCDALMGIKGRYRKFALLNDSIFALDQFDGMLKPIGTIKATENKNDIPVPISMTSLNYHDNTAELDNWVESVFRGFDSYGVDVFMEHSCVPDSHGSFCNSQLNKAKKKRCITEYHELEMAWQFPFPERQVQGLFPGTVPEVFQKVVNNPFPTWVCNAHFWKNVLLPKGFPAAKANCEPMLGEVSDPILDTCTTFLDRSILCDMDFSNAEIAIKYPKLNVVNRV